MKIFDKASMPEFTRGVQATKISKKFGMLAAPLLLAATAAHAQSVSIPQVHSTVSGGSAITTLTGLPTGTNGDATLDLSLFGDLDYAGGGSIVAETLTVFLDGVNVGVVGPTGDQCNNAVNQSLIVDQATLAPLIADGQLDITFQGSSEVTSGLCGSYNGSPSGVSFVVSGTITYDGVTGPAAEEQIASFMENRARALVQNQPDVARFVDGRAGGRLNADVTQGAGSIDFASAARGPVWATLTGSATEFEEGNDQSYFLGAAGAHLSFGENTIVGAMLQMDWAEQDFSNGDKAEGKGWLVGPYFAAQISEHPLFLDGRLLYGKTDNEFTPDGDATDSFDGERWLAMLNLQGRVEMEHFTMFPIISASHVRDTQDAYTDSNSVDIDSQDIEQTEVALGVDFEKPMLSHDLVLVGGLSGIWSDTVGDADSSSAIGNYNGWRGRIDAGVNYSNGAGLNAGLSAFVDGLGEDDLKTVGLSLMLDYQF
ncbi:hypothetical protein DS901_00380 [Loktanella sp. D2R18]|uniref:autotransporter outer membrane beta-barrel domain-containing protein n=1 Tax=Rhodobacterales TaxID=204455 RepID=UPI000DEB1476|nr:MULTISPECIES: autotransporter outer membrane beta-barrel domain-containing protein [Rhodobacterales]MDO6591251.1 autotransporter outer membrane beta-barrel domain-containing protein [Yoonia sp. 1_MG-2023]RBW46206.1 hypothetical protein DS901_00380 [Loktanella sp. D2R18]